MSVCWLVGWSVGRSATIFFRDRGDTLREHVINSVESALRLLLVLDSDARKALAYIYQYHPQYYFSQVKLIQLW